MKLAKVHIKNFRCYSDEFAVELGNLTVFVGKNDIGKSSILDALSIFFGESKMDSDDGCLSGDKEDVRIICEFEDLPEHLVIDADYPTTLTDEYLLNQDGRLEIHQVFNGSLKSPKLTGTFAHAVHPSIEGRNDLLLLKNRELKDRAKSLGVDLDEVNQRVNTEIRRQIWKSTSELDLQLAEIPLDVETAKKIWAQLRNYLPNFALFKSDRSSTDQDSEAQDPMKTAIKEALKAQETELNRIAEHVETEVKTIAEQTVAKLREMDPTLANELNPRFAPPNWANVFKVSLTGDEEIPINKRGSGVRRLILLNFFRARAEQRAVEREATSIIYAVEEPETSQHPNNQKMLLNAFYQLSEQPDCQVILTTHTPMLGRLVPSDSLRYVYFDDTGTRKIQQGDDETYTQAAKALGVLADHDVKLFIGVEGGHDINFLKNISKMLNDNGEIVPDLQLLEDNGEIIFFPLGGSNLALCIIDPKK
jgi:predicted ATP-dependent endonuclease of OLD family